MVNWRQLGIHGKRKLRNSLRALKGQPRPEIAVQHCLAPALAPMACIDVGASFGIHRPWELFLHSPNVLWLAVEPNSTEADFLKSWSYPAQLQRCNEGLSGTGGERTLYITHNPKAAASCSRGSLPRSGRAAITRHFSIHFATSRSPQSH